MARPALDFARSWCDAFNSKVRPLFGPTRGGKIRHADGRPLPWAGTAHEAGVMDAAHLRFLMGDLAGRMTLGELVRMAHVAGYRVEVRVTPAREEDHG